MLTYSVLMSALGQVLLPTWKGACGGNESAGSRLSSASEPSCLDPHLFLKPFVSLDRRHRPGGMLSLSSPFPAASSHSLGCRPSSVREHKDIEVLEKYMI